MADLFWAFENPAAKAAGALPPSLLELNYGRREGAAPKDLQRAAALGRPITPADCGPIRVIAGYGVLVSCPGSVTLRRAESPRAERSFAPGSASFGLAEISGDGWPVGDTGLIASWIGGSEYVKIQTGIMIFFPRGMSLYQGPLPNVQLTDAPSVEVMAGIEYASKNRLWPSEGEALAWSSINVIVRLPEHGRTVKLDRGDPLCWAFPVPARSAITLKKLALSDTAQDAAS